MSIVPLRCPSVTEMLFVNMYYPYHNGASLFVHVTGMCLIRVWTKLLCCSSELCYYVAYVCLLAWCSTRVISCVTAFAESLFDISTFHITRNYFYSNCLNVHLCSVCVLWFFYSCASSSSLFSLCSISNFNRLLCDYMRSWICPLILGCGG